MSSKHVEDLTLLYLQIIYGIFRQTQLVYIDIRML